MTSLGTSFIVQLRVIGALMLRESRSRFGKTQLGYLWSLAEPIGLVLTLTLAFSALGNKPQIGDSLPLFFANGMLMFLVYRRISNFCSSALDANRALLSYPIVQQLDTVLARALLEVLTAIMGMLLIYGTLIVVWREPLPHDMTRLAAAFVLMAILGFSHGTITAVICTYYESWRRIDEFVSRPLFFISGVFYTPERLPQSVRDMLLWNPLMHGLELGRTGYYTGYDSPSLNLPYLLAWTFGLCLVALLAERVSRTS